jgi:hypothetical protein
MVSLERAISCIRADDRHIGHAVAQPKASYALAELIDVSDDIIAEYERQTLGLRSADTYAAGSKCLCS